MANPLRDCVSLSAWMDAAAAAEQLWPSYTTFSLLGSPHLTSGAHGQHPGHQLCNVSTSMQPRLINNDFYRIFIKLYNIGIIKI